MPVCVCLFKWLEGKIEFEQTIKNYLNANYTQKDAALLLSVTETNISYLSNDSIFKRIDFLCAGQSCFLKAIIGTRQSKFQSNEELVCLVEPFFERRKLVLFLAVTAYTAVNSETCR